MRLVIFASLGLFGMSVAASGLTDSANAISKERIRGSVTEVYSGGTIAIDGYESHVRLEAISDGVPNAISERELRQSLSTLIEGTKISCQRLNTDNYGTVVARCWDGTGQEINNLLVRQNIPRID